ncbi:MAG: LLM class flavin-dependent oxidoreductase [Candidatus Nanopelagicales bacterium]
MGVDIGVVLPSFSSESHRWPPQLLRRAIDAVVGYNFSGVWLLEHLTRPSTYNTAWTEPVVTASWIAGVNAQAGLGSSILVVPLRNTVVLTWQLLTLQYLSGSAFRLGVGAGYVPEEFRAVSAERESRGAKLDQFLETYTEAARTGLIDVAADGTPIPAMEIGPAPVEVGQILIGGAARATTDNRIEFPAPVLRRIVRWGGWLSSPKSEIQLQSDWETIVSAAGRKHIAHNHLNYVYLSDCRGRDAALADQSRAFEWLYGAERGMSYALENCLVGTTEEISSRLRRLPDLGVETIILQLVAPTWEEWFVQLSRLARLRSSLST